MKKMLCVMFLSLVLSMPVPSFASALHGLEPLYYPEAFSTFPMHDLLCARNAIEDVLENRGYFEITISKGKHVAGEDIPAGKYAISFPEDSLGYTYWINILSESGECADSLIGVADTPSKPDFSYTYEPPMVELITGQAIELTDDILVTLYTYDGI